MNRRVVHLTFRGGTPTDASGFGNHAVVTGAVPGTGTELGSYVCSGGRALVVPASPTLRRLTSLRVRMRCRLTSTAQRRFNLMEGHASFVLAVYPDRSVNAAVFADDGRWRGMNTPVGVIRVNEWHTVEMAHDGISRCEVRVDGILRASAALPGPLRGVGPYGIGVGRWPDFATYGFEGNIGETEVWTYDPYATFRDLLDDCCEPDDRLLAEIGAKVAASGDPARALSFATHLVEQTARLIRDVRAAGGTAEMDTLTVELRAALLRPGRPDLPRVRGRLVALVGRTVGGTRLAAYRREADELLAALGLTTVDAARLLGALCLGDLVPAGTVPAADNGWPPAADAPWDAGADLPLFPEVHDG